MRVTFIALLMFFSVAGQAVAATVNATGGQVFLSHGEGYKRIAGSAQAGPGARVVANPGGSGQIVYADGCVVEVSPGTVVVVAKHSPCSGGGSGGGSTGGDTGMFAVGAAIVGAGVGAAALMGKDKSASP